ncbi:MAG: hypothetical protein ACI8ZM_004571 [Crocinitomix sp.]|jgi:hypothetical protein
MKMENLSKQIGLLFLVFLPALGFGQELENQFKRFSFGLSYEPNLSYRQLKYEGENKMFADLRNKNEVADFGFVTGLSLKTRLTKRLTLEYGVSFVRSGFKTKYSNLDFVSENTDFPIKAKTKYTFRSFIIPIKANFNFDIGKLNCYATLGVSYNSLFDRKSTLLVQFPNGNIEESADNNTTAFENMTFSLIAGFGVNYVLFDRITLAAEPLFRRNLSSIVPDKNAEEYPYSIGLNLKIFYNLKYKQK